MFAAGAVLVFVAAYLAGAKNDGTPQSAPAPIPGAATRYLPYVFLDDATGCQYLSTHTSAPLTPRIAADGKTHMGCKGAQP
jgi:hypothetical protein